MHILKRNNVDLSYVDPDKTNNAPKKKTAYDTVPESKFSQQ